MATTAFGVGASPRRIEDSRFLRGKGQYVADIYVVGMQEVAFVRSTVAHGIVRRINIPDAHKNAVFTANDLESVEPVRDVSPLKGFKPSVEPILAIDKVRFVGELVAMCMAPTRAEAEDIAASVTVDYEELPPIIDLTKAATAQPIIHPGWQDNIFIEFNATRGDENAIKAAPIKVTRRVRTSRQCIFPMEGRGLLANWDDRLRCLTITTSTQIPHTVQTGIAQCLRMDHGSIRVIAPDVGGGFGYKCVVSREEIAVAWLAKKTGLPIRWLEDCREHLAANANCREHYYDITGYATKEGKLLGIECEAIVDAGAYSTYPVSAAVEAAQIANILPGPYILDSFKCRAVAVATNKPPILAYRGVARPGACLALETIMDAIAREANVEPFEVRLLNLVRPEQMPFDNILDKHFDSGNYPECLQKCVDEIDLKTVRSRQQQPESDGKLIGVGFAFFNEQGAHGTSVLAAWGRPVVPGYEQAAVRLLADGELEICVGTHSHGQGHETTLAQIAHEILSVDFAKIRVLQGDTLYAPYSTGTWGSRTIVMAGGAVARSAKILGQRACKIGAWLLQADPKTASIRGEHVHCGNASISLRDIARAWYLKPQHLPADIDPAGLEVTTGYKADRDSGTFSYAAHAAVVAVDPATGLVDVVDYVVVEDGGILINPQIADGQVCGGTVQGIGTALYEEMPYDAQGQPLASTMLDYILPGATEAPSIRIFHMETPSPYTEFGSKGIGEGGAVGPPAAILAAVNDALHPLGIAINDLPIRPADILRKINEAKIGTNCSHADHDSHGI
jgi:aerobic carbon-monoxide dehydrogenase large subunit